MNGVEIPQEFIDAHTEATHRAPETFECRAALQNEKIEITDAFVAKIPDAIRRIQKPETLRTIVQTVENECVKNGIGSELPTILALIEQESTFDANAKHKMPNPADSSAGLMQLTKTGVDEVNRSQKRKGIDRLGYGQMTGIEKNIEAGVALFSQYLNKNWRSTIGENAYGMLLQNEKNNGGDEKTLARKLAVAAFNVGPVGVKNRARQNQNFSQWPYTSSVENRRKNYLPMVS